ncbi:TlpA disulfide reductase family protein [Pyrinomonas sp.]|uniref:TlpA family protein disulfide reductase n=1 Tax=Pyrinomonas sp. TaxID=2080306 RepID=UPI003320F464
MANRKGSAICSLIHAALLIAIAVGPIVCADGGAEVKFRGVDGKTYDLARFRGKVVLVSFGASWCAPCLVELEALEELKREYASKPVEFLWVSIETEEERSDWTLRNFARDNRLTIPVLRDPRQVVYSRFSSRVRMPLVIFFDREGKPAGKPHVGMATPEVYKKVIRQRLDALLEGDQ